jgi:hypothetical protein
LSIKVGTLNVFPVGSSSTDLIVKMAELMHLWMRTSFTSNARIA